MDPPMISFIGMKHGPAGPYTEPYAQVVVGESTIYRKPLGWSIVAAHKAYFAMKKMLGRPCVCCGLGMERKDRSRAMPSMR